MKKAIIATCLGIIIQVFSPSVLSNESPVLLTKHDLSAFEASDFNQQMIEKKGEFINAIKQKPLKTTNAINYLRNSDGTISLIKENVTLSKNGTVTVLNRLDPNNDSVGRRYIIGTDGTIVWLDKHVPKLDEKVGRIYIIGEDGTVIFLN